MNSIVKYNIPIELFFKNKVDTETTANNDLFDTASQFDGGVEELKITLPIQVIDTDKLIPTQVGLEKYRLDAIKGDVDDNHLPLVIENDGLYYIEDGHHRIARFIINNEPIRVRVYSGKIEFKRGGTLSDTLSVAEVECALNRKMHWWRDDVVTVGGDKYKKDFLNPSYSKLNLVLNTDSGKLRYSK